MHHLGGNAHALRHEDRDQIEWVFLLLPALQPLLHRPCGMADVIHGFAKLEEDARVHVAARHRSLEVLEVKARLLQTSSDVRLCRGCAHSHSPWEEGICGGCYTQKREAR